MSIGNVSDKFGGASGHAVQPVSPVPHVNHATEYPSSGQHQQPKQARKPLTLDESGQVVPDDSPNDKDVIYNAKGQIVRLDGTPRLDEIS